jgi:hypothetical protein
MLGKLSERSDLEVETYTRINVDEIAMLEADQQNKNSRTWTRKQMREVSIARIFRAQEK